MARTVNYANPGNEDLAYLLQRPWLVKDAELQGHKNLRGNVAAYAAGERAAEESEEVITYAQGTVDQLRAELESRGLETKGKKAELIARLEEDDAREAQAAAGAAGGTDSGKETSEEDGDGEEGDGDEEEVPEED